MQAPAAAYDDSVVDRLQWELEDATACDAIRARLAVTETPMILQGAIDDWEASRWTPQLFAEKCADMDVTVRVGKRTPGVIPRESGCFQLRCKIPELCGWLMEPPGGNERAQSDEPPRETTSSSGLSAIDPNEFFAYLDYRYFHEMFESHEDLRDASLDWSRFGPVTGGATPQQSVFWMGSPGAATGLHRDTYGANVVAQVYGTKEWILFPPSCTRYLRPTRIPYEESSVYSELSASEVLETPGAVRVLLRPGEVLFVPHHWWHQVRCVTVALSINVWVPHPSDAESRVEEGLVKAALEALHPPIQGDAGITWLNPNEELEGLDGAVAMLGGAVEEERCMQQQQQPDAVAAAAAAATHTDGDDAASEGTGGRGVAAAGGRQREEECCIGSSSSSSSSSIGSKRPRTAEEGPSPQRQEHRAAAAGGVTAADVFLAFTHPETLEVAARVLLDRRRDKDRNQ